MTPGEQYRLDLQRQKAHEKSVKSQADWALRQHRVREKYFKEIKNLKLNTLYKPISNSSINFCILWELANWCYFVVRSRNMKQETITLEMMYLNRHNETKNFSFNDYKYFQGTFEQVFSKKEKTIVGLRGLVP